jgi:hypothetical protein
MAIAFLLPRAGEIVGWMARGFGVILLKMFTDVGIPLVNWNA